MFEYTAIIHKRPLGYSFLAELPDCTCDQISIETARSNLDTSVLARLTGKTIMLDVIDLSDPSVRSMKPSSSGPNSPADCVNAICR